MNKYRDGIVKGTLGRVALLVALATGSLHARAGDFWLHTGGLSSHASNQARNETHSGKGLEYRFNPEWAVGFGRYQNSFFRDSRYVLANWSPVHVHGARLGLTGGLVTGYHKKKYGLHGQAVPVLLPSVDYRWDRVTVLLMAAPPLAGISKGSLMLQIKLSLKE